jgi:hypothetical protein
MSELANLLPDTGQTEFGDAPMGHLQPRASELSMWKLWQMPYRIRSLCGGVLDGLPQGGDPACIAGDPA